MQVFIIEFLIALCLLLIFVVCRKKGFFSVLSLLATIIILLQFSIPFIIKGYNPILITFISAIGMVILIVYLTEGFHYASHVSIAAIIVSFSVTSFLTWACINAMGLTGLVSEETAYVVQYGVSSANLQNLLIAGIMIGTLGILTEMVVTQVSVVAELLESGISEHKILFTKAYNLGVTHLGSMINTLFLIYAGVSLPMLIIIIAGQATLANMLHSQLLVSDLISTLTGVIGLIICMPIATGLATWWLGKK